MGITVLNLLFFISVPIFFSVSINNNNVTPKSHFGKPISYFYWIFKI